MHASVQTLEGLEHKLTVSIPNEQFSKKITEKLNHYAKQAKIDGFRPGKAPASVIKARYGKLACQEAAQDLIQPTLVEALQQKDLTPAGYPNINIESMEENADFSYTATFEIMPNIDIKEIEDNTTIEMVGAEVNANDVDAMLVKLQEQQVSWTEVDRQTQDKDKIIIDFKGFIDSKPFDKGDAEDFELVLGKGTMIPGFEEKIIGHSTNQPFEMTVNFPKDYHDANLADKEATFAITIKKVMQANLPEINDDFAEKFNIKEGGTEALRRDIEQNMKRELEQRVNALNRDKIFDKLLEVNPILLPKVLIDKEIAHLNHEMYHRVFGNKHSDNEKIPEFPRHLFEEQAKRRIHLGLLFSKYLETHGIKAPEERVDAMIEKMASAYEDPQELRDYYRSNKDNMADIRSLVLEEMVAEKIIEKAIISEKGMTYDAVMNAKKGA